MNAMNEMIEFYLTDELHDFHELINYEIDGSICAVEYYTGETRLFKEKLNIDVWEIVNMLFMKLRHPPNVNVVVCRP